MGLFISWINTAQRPDDDDNDGDDDDGADDGNDPISLVHLLDNSPRLLDQRRICWRPLGSLWVSRRRKALHKEALHEEAKTASTATDTTATIRATWVAVSNDLHCWLGALVANVTSRFCGLGQTRRTRRRTT